MQPYPEDISEQMQIGTSRDTSEFACDSIRYWWLTYGCVLYPLATSILLLCDGGGSNSSRAYLFKECLQALSNELGIEIRIAHYPPYTSKYNPIEHRLFPHVSRVCEGVIFETVETVKDLMAGVIKSDTSALLTGPVVLPLYNRRSSDPAGDGPTVDGTTQIVNLP